MQRGEWRRGACTRVGHVLDACVAHAGRVLYAPKTEGATLLTMRSYSVGESFISTILARSSTVNCCSTACARSSSVLSSRASKDPNCREAQHSSRTDVERWRCTELWSALTEQARKLSLYDRSRTPRARSPPTPCSAPQSVSGSVRGRTLTSYSSLARPLVARTLSAAAAKLCEAEQRGGEREG